MKTGRGVPGFDIGGFVKKLRFGKTIGKNVIKDRILDPVRGVVKFNHRFLPLSGLIIIAVDFTI